MATRKATKKPAKPARKAKKPVMVQHHYEGPAEWLMPMMEETYSKLRPKDDTAAPAAAPKPRRAAKPDKDKQPFVSTYSPGEGEQALASLEKPFWSDQMAEFQKRRTKIAPGAAMRGPIAPGMPAIVGQNNWTPLGPSIVARGQTNNRAPVSGRIAGIAIAPGGLRAYVATAVGGVWRSDDGGASWFSTMDNFDANPNNFASCSLACGAIAIDPANPDRIYVGTGEGDTDALFNSRIVNSLPAYRGIGPIRSDDGGLNWVNEPSTPSLAGFAFFQIAVDPTDPNHCVAATTNGLYERVPSGGSFEWQQRRTGRHSSVIVTRAAGVTRWFAAQWGGPIVTSTNGNTWASVGTGLPATVRRIALGAQPDNPNVVYAFCANANGALDSVRRLDGVAGPWINITSVPNVLPVDANGRSQGDYDLCIAVDPNNVNRIYLGGSFFNADPFPGSVWRCIVTASGATYSMTGTSIGGDAHADVHVLVHTPTDSNALWTGTDGGLYLNTNPTAGGGFVHRNTGLATLCTNFLGQHPTEPAVMYVGLQDNGTAKYTGEQVWRHVLFADGGYCVVNWNDPFRVLLYANGSLLRATDGGLDYTSWSDVTPAGTDWVIMAAPVVGTPVNPGTPSEANIVAYGAGTAIFDMNGNFVAIDARVLVSTNFGASWPTNLLLETGTAGIFSMVFASATRLFVGMTNGHVYRVDKTGATWAATRIDNAAGGALPLAGLITDIAVDRSDATLHSIFITFGGVGDFRHVWRFNGTAWEARSGMAGSGTELLDVEHNAIAYDAVTSRVYVGADIGAWESTDGGLTWNPLSNGLPDAPVYDLQLHPTARLLRAVLHGRGVWEWKLDAPILPSVELYIRDTMLDTARGVNTDGRNDPSIFPTGPVYHYLSPNIKVDVPTPAGYQTPTTAIDFFTFNEVIQDGSNHVGTNSPPPTVHNRYYVEVHNRGRVDATNVQVMAAVTNAATGLGLPAGYTANVISGTPFSDPKWITLGVQTVPLIRAGFPRIVPFDLPSTVLPLPASLMGNSHWCSVVFLHSAQDGFTNTIGNVDALTLDDRKVGQKNLHIVEFVGAPPPPGTGIGYWAMLIVSGANLRSRRPIDLQIHAKDFRGDIHLLLPPPLFPRNLDQQAKGLRRGSAALVKRWIDGYTPEAKRLFYEAKFSEYQYKLLTEAMKNVARQTPLVLRGGGQAELLNLPLSPKDEIPIFLRIDAPANSRPGSSWDFDVVQVDSKSKEVLGGSRYRVVVNRKG